MRPAIVFDFDNTLVKTIDSAETVLAILRRFGTQGDNDIILADIRRQTSDRSALGKYIPAQHFAEAYREVLRANLLSASTALCPVEMLDALGNLRNEWDLFVVSGRDGSSLTSALRRLGLTPFFRGIVWDRPEIPCKPSPGGLLYLAKEYDVRPSDMIAIGDRDTDYLAASGAGCLFLGACWYRSRFTVPVDKCHDIQTLQVCIDNLRRSERR